ncbi:MAG: hypothetical protein PF694_12235 [Bacteroidetes bacterium]|jgi:hypothetical protein|nr:hypothetical protein [Bacteroidota bacterium]
MDLIKLKSAWTILQQDVINNDKVDENSILNAVHSKSKSEISKIMSGLHFKFIVASISVLVAISLALLSILSPTTNPLDFIFSPVESATFFFVMALTVSVIVYFNYQAYSHIKSIQRSSLNLKDNLKRFIDTMNKAIALNIFSDTFMTPIIFAWAYYAYAFKDHQLAFDLRTAMLFVLPVLIGVISYFVQRFMQHLKFGKYLKRLSCYLKSLQNNSAEL